MIYESEGWQSDDRAMFGTLEKMKEYGTMLLVHAESARVLDELIARSHTPELMAKYGARLHPMTRPNFIEAEAIERAVHWCEVTGGQLYIVHMSEIGVIYVGGDKVFSIGPNRSINVVAHGNVLGRPNGVTWDSTAKKWVVVSFDTFHSEVYALNPADSTRTILATGKGRYDGIESLSGGRYLVTCWQDSSVHLISGRSDRPIVRNVPSPADIGIDTRRGRLAIPVGNNRVEFWDLAGA